MVLLVLVTQNLILSIRILQNLEKKLAYSTKNYVKMSLIFGVPLRQVSTASSLLEFLAILLLLTQGILVLRSKIYYEDFISALNEENKCLEIVVKFGKTNNVHCTAFCTA